MSDKKTLKDVISEVVQSFLFPDGCLDLGVDEQEVFIETLNEEINEWMTTNSKETNDT